MLKKSEYGAILESINGQPVTDMYYTFYYCTSLTTAPEIPSGVENMFSTFQYCENLTGAITIDATPSSYRGCFTQVDMSKITLAGSCNATLKQNLADTGKNPTLVTIIN